MTDFGSSISSYHHHFWIIIIFRFIITFRPTSSDALSFQSELFFAQSHACLLSFTACLSFHSGESPSKWIVPEKADVVSLPTTQSQLWIYLQHARGKPRSKQNVWCTNQRRSGRQRCYSSCTYKANDRKWWCYENAYLPTQAPWNPSNRPIAKIFE